MFIIWLLMRLFISLFILGLCFALYKTASCTHRRDAIDLWTDPTCPFKRRNCFPWEDFFYLLRNYYHINELQLFTLLIVLAAWFIVNSLCIGQRGCSIHKLPVLCFNSQTEITILRFKDYVFLNTADSKFMKFGLCACKNTLYKTGLPKSCLPYL